MSSSNEFERIANTFTNEKTEGRLREQVPLTSKVMTADSYISHTAAIQYWNSVNSDVNGMLGGYPQVSRIDLRASALFLTKLSRTFKPEISPNEKPWKLAVDCGAGIGRVTHGLLSNICDIVDVVEPVEKFAVVIRNGSLKEEHKVGDIYVEGLENWNPTKRYDLIWNQWCLGHLTDEELVKYLIRCGQSITESGFIVVKENISAHPKGDMYDSEDSSVTRTDLKFKSIFKDAGLNLIRAEEQLGFPKHLGLLPVRLYALRQCTKSS